MQKALEALEAYEIQAMQVLIENASNKNDQRTPGDRRRDDLLRNFKYLQRIGYGCMESICQVLACKYYYRPRSVYELINRNLNKVHDQTFTEVPLDVEELLIITQKLKMPNWMDGLTRRHNEVRTMFHKWKSLGNLSFLCKLLGYKYYYKPNSVRYILKN